MLAAVLGDTVAWTVSVFLAVMVTSLLWAVELGRKRPADEDQQCSCVEWDVQQRLLWSEQGRIPAPLLSTVALSKPLGFSEPRFPLCGWTMVTGT